MFSVESFKPLKRESYNIFSSVFFNLTNINFLNIL